MAAGGLAVGVLAGISWHLAGKIQSEALAVEPCPAMPAYDDVRFVGLSPGQARLVAIGHQPALSRPELYGITWPGGIGQLGASVAAVDGVVTRPLTVTFGSAPRVGQLAALERAYFLGDAAAALGIPVEHVAIPGPLGPLPAWYFPGRSETFVIGVHGQNGTRKDVLRIVDIVRRMGFPALAVTYRGDLGVAPDPSGYLRYGQTEWRDIEAAVRWSLEHGARSVVLAGQSMGGGIVAAFLRHSPLAAMVARVVFDAPMLDLHAAVDYQVRRHTTLVMGRLLAPLVWTAERIARLRYGVDWSAIAYLDETTWLKVPALVIHGDDDPRVPVSISATLKERHPSLAHVEVFAGAGHLESWNVDRARYTALVRSFLTPVAPSPALLLDGARSRTVWWCRAVTGVQVEHHRGAAYRAAARVAVRLGEQSDAVCRSAHMNSPVTAAGRVRPLLPAADPRIVGIVNITEDSFSDGGRYLDPQAAIVHARRLRAEGADVVELGPAASHPGSAPVTAAEEQRRLAPVLEQLAADGIPVSVDSFRPQTQRFAIAAGAAYLNDIHGFGDPDTYPALAASQCQLIVMHAIQPAGSATRVVTDPAAVWDGTRRFFAGRLAALREAGISGDRLIIDPGLGYFLGSTPGPSLAALAGIRELKAAFGADVLASPSRKSFLRALTGRDITRSGPATLAAEIFAAWQGADYIRTHDVAAARDAFTVLAAIAREAATSPWSAGGVACP